MKKPEEVIELISSGVKTQADLAAMFHGLKSRVIESALAGEMEHHLGNNQNHLLSDDLLPANRNRRNGYSSKLIKNNSGDISKRP